ncbi:MAG: hypothetical protein ACJAUY_001662 [Cognaticolwellia sp.]|jgi:hypothetical protein
MIKHEHTISVSNATATINQIHTLLKLRNIDIKKSDCKQLIAQILNYSTSNELDNDIKQHNLKQHKQNKFDRNGQCKQQKGFMLKNFNNPFKLLDTFNKNPIASVIVGVDEAFHLDDGYHYKEGDYLFTQNKFAAFKFIIEWDKNAHFEYIPYDKIEVVKFGTEGYWDISLKGNAETCFGDDCYVSTYGLSADINSECVDKHVLEEYIINDFLDRDYLPFFFYSRETLTEYLNDWFEQEYYNNFPKKPSEMQYMEYIKKFIPHLGIENILWREVKRSGPDYLKLLKEFGADYTAVDLMEIAAKTGDIKICDFLISEGNSISTITKSTRDDDLAKFFVIAHCSGRGFSEAIKSFYKIAFHYGVDFNIQDEIKKTVLHHCACYGCEELYQLLVSLGANETIKDNSGQTPKQIMKKNIYKSDDLFNIFSH